MVCRPLLAFPGRNRNYRDIVCRGSPGVCPAFTAVRSRRGFARQPPALPSLPRPPSPQELNSSSVIFMTFLPGRLPVLPIPPPRPAPTASLGKGKAKETRSRDCSLKLSASAWRPPQSIHHREGGLLTPQNTTESMPWRGVQAGKRCLSGLRFTRWGLHAGWSTPSTSTLRPVPAGFPRSGCCSRSPRTVAATRLGCRSTGGQRHPRPGGIPPLCPKQDSSATGLSHQDPPAWCSGDHWGPTWTPPVGSLGTKLQHRCLPPWPNPNGTTCPPWLSSPWFNSRPCSSAWGAGGSVTLGAEPKLGRKHQQKTGKIFQPGMENPKLSVSQRFPSADFWRRTGGNGARRVGGLLTAPGQSH